MISIFINGVKAEAKRTRFSDGAVEYRLEKQPTYVYKLHYSVSPQINVNELITELAVVDSLFSSSEPESKTLYLPYLPYARADRKFSELGSDGLCSFLKLLDAFGFSEVTVKDAHNASVVPANFIISDQLYCLKSVRPEIPMNEYDAVVSPDKGAIAKAGQIADHFGLPLVVCAKTRNVDSGALSNPEIVQGDVKGKRVLSLMIFAMVAIRLFSWQIFCTPKVLHLWIYT